VRLLLIGLLCAVSLACGPGAEPPAASNGSDSSQAHPPSPWPPPGPYCCVHCSGWVYCGYYVVTGSGTCCAGSFDPKGAFPPRVSAAC
jgi:hypothetical protein